MSAAPDNTPNTVESLPFDPRTLLLGLLKKRFLLLKALPVAILFGVVVGLLLGRHVYEAHTLVLYRPQNLSDQNDPAARLQTRKDMVKVVENLEAVRNTLDREITPEQLGAMYTVEVAKSSTLMVVSAKDNDPVKAAQLANTLVDVFIKEQLLLSNTELALRLDDAHRNEALVVKHAMAADAALTKFVKQHGIIDINKAGNAYTDQYAHIEMDHQQSQNDLLATNQQIVSINEMLEKDRESTRDKQKDSKQLDDIAAISVRIDHIRQAIADDKASQVSAATLAQLESEMNLAKKMYAVGAISQQELQKAVTAYKQQQAISNDTKQTQEWKQQLARLEILAGANTVSPLVQELTKKLIDCQLEAIRLQSTINHTQIEMAWVKQIIAHYPAIVREYSILAHDAEVARSNKNLAIEKTAALQAEYDARTPDYSIVSRATPNRKPTSSTRTPLTITCIIVSLLLFTLIIVGTIMFDPTVKSSAEAQIKLRLPVWRELPCFTDGLLPTTTYFADPHRGMLARLLHQTIQREPVRYLVTSPKHQAGVTTVALNLATAYVNLGKRVMLLSAPPICADLAALTPAQAMGLAGYLDGRIAEIAAAIIPHGLPGVDCLASGNEEQYPLFVAQSRMRQVLDELAGQYDVLFIDAPPILPYGDTESLVQWVDAVILVVDSPGNPVATIRRAIERIQVMRPAYFGSVLNRVDKVFLLED